MKLIHRIALFVSADAMLVFAFGCTVQALIKIGASLSITGADAALGQNLLPGYQLLHQAREPNGRRARAQTRTR